MNKFVNYALLKTEGTLLIKSVNGSTEYYRLGNGFYRAQYRSLGGFVGSAGYIVTKLAEIEKGGCGR
jgi:hypothetical protein